MKTALILAGAVALIAASAQDGFGRVADALAAGTQAKSSNARAAAAQVLIANGAHPADGEADLAGHWAKGKRAAYRDRVLGPAYRRVALRSGGSAHFEQTFFAGQMARVAVVAVDRTPFGLTVIDDDGAHQCAEKRRERCDWTPIATTRFRIELENRAPKPASFYVLMQ